MLNGKIRNPGCHIPVYNNLIIKVKKNTISLDLWSGISPTKGIYPDILNTAWIGTRYYYFGQCCVEAETYRSLMKSRDLSIRDSSSQA